MTDPLHHGLLAFGLTNAAAATLLAVPVAGLTRVWRNPHAARILWLCVLARLVVPPLFAVPVWEAGDERPEARGPLIAERADQPRGIGVPTDAGRADGASSTDLLPPATSLPTELIPPAVGPPPVRLLPPASADGGVGVEGAAVSRVPLVEDSAAAHGEPPARSPGTFVAILWPAGTGLFWSLVAVRVVRFRRALGRTAAADGELLRRADAVAGRFSLKHTPAVRLTDGDVGPLLWAAPLRRLGEPAVLVPRGLLARLDGPQTDCLLAHEFAHLARGDHRVRWGELLILGLYWWLPTAWWAVRRGRAAEERCCDAAVLAADPHAARPYAAALLAAAEFLSTPPAKTPSAKKLPVPSPASGLGRPSALKERFTMILHETAPKRPRRTLRLAVTACGLAALSVGVGVADDPPGPEEPATEPPVPVVLTEKQLRELSAEIDIPLAPLPPLGSTFDPLPRAATPAAGDPDADEGEPAEAASPLADAVREFNTRTAEHRARLGEPPLTAAEVVAAASQVRQTEQSVVPDELVRAYQSIARTKRLPAGATLEIVGTVGTDPPTAEAWVVLVRRRPEPGELPPPPAPDQGVDHSYPFPVRTVLPSGTVGPSAGVTAEPNPAADTVGGELDVVVIPRSGGDDPGDDAAADAGTDGPHAHLSPAVRARLIAALGRVAADETQPAAVRWRAVAAARASGAMPAPDAQVLFEALRAAAERHDRPEAAQIMEAMLAHGVQPRSTRAVRLVAGGPWMREGDAHRMVGLQFKILGHLSDHADGVRALAAAVEAGSPDDPPVADQFLLSFLRRTRPTTDALADALLDAVDSPDPRVRAAAVAALAE